MNLHLASQVQSDLSGGSRPTLHTRGLAIARLLSGAWRESAAMDQLPLDLSEAELTEVTPLLCRSGAGALAWWQLRDTPLADRPAALELREVYRRHRLSALLHEREIAGIVSRLRAEGIEPVLIKGWAIARRYPDRALRPYGDIDLCVRPDQHTQAAQVLARMASLAGPFVDLHSGFTRIGQTKRVQAPRSKVQSLSAARRLWTQDSGLRTQGNGDWDELFARSVLVHTRSEPGAVATGSMPPPVRELVSNDPVATTTPRGLPARGPRSAPGSDFLDPLTTSVPVRVLSDEDHLRLLCLHLLRSGAHRPPWLCDVALLVEQVQSPTRKVQSPKFEVQSPTDRVAVTESSRGLSAQRDTPGSNRINVPDPEGVKEDFGLLDSGFDWDVCLGRNPIEANWVGVAVRLAHELLGASIGNTPFVDQQLPSWLAPALLEQWGGKRVNSPQSSVNSLPAVNRLWTLDLGLWTSLFRRWDNPIRATAAVGGRFDERSRLPYRLLESAMRLPELPAQVRKLVASGQ